MGDELVKELSAQYSCDDFGRRCIDAHNGRAFKSTGYFDGNRFYEIARPETKVVVVAFAREGCEEKRLLGLKFSNGTVKNLDTAEEGTPSAASGATDNKTTDKEKKKALEQVKDTQASVQSLADAREDLDATASEAKAKCTGTCKGVNDKLKALSFVDVPTEQPVIGNLTDVAGALQATDKQLSSRLTEATQSYANAKENIPAAFANLQSSLDQIKAANPAVADDLRKTIATAQELAKKGKGTEALARLDDAKKKIAALPTEDTNKWPSVQIRGQGISIQYYTVQVPDGDDISFFTISAENRLPAAEEDASKQRPVWPETTLTVKVDHGSYWRAFGYMFAAVYHGKRVQDSKHVPCKSIGDDGADGCKWQPQGLLTGTLFYNRPKFVFYDSRNWYPGVQFGINADLTKPLDALSVGIVFEPITGFALSAGGIFYARASTSVPATNGSTPQENVFLPYVGISINNDFIDALESKATDKAGNASDAKTK